ncbi:MAG: hypothetical protein N3A65_08770 [candidate division WOR-3 bacterium]|nr:hypothetical protein [candidate division WOR-3 bacterium]
MKREVNMKFPVIIIGAILFVVGLFFAYSGSIISLYLIIGGIGCFIGGIVLELIASKKIREEKKSDITQKRKFLGSPLELIIAGVIFLIIASVFLPNFRKSDGYFYIFMIIGYTGLLLILIGLIQIVISIIKGKEKRKKLY